MFSTHLRHHPLWPTLSPYLLSSSSPWRFRETNLSQTHHISLPLLTTLSSQKNSSTLFILLIIPPDLSPTSTPSTVQKLERFSSLTGGANVLVALILLGDDSDVSGGSANKDAAGLEEFVQLQNSILTLPTSIPLIPIPSPQHLLPTLQSYIATLTSPTPIHPSAATANANLHLHLLSLCTTNPPLSTHSVFVLSDLFPSLRDMELETRSAEGRAFVDSVCGEDDEQGKGRLIGREVGEFWEEEVILE